MFTGFIFPDGSQITCEVLLHEDVANEYLESKNLKRYFLNYNEKISITAEDYLVIVLKSIKVGSINQRTATVSFYNRSKFIMDYILELKQKNYKIEYVYPQEY